LGKTVSRYSQLYIAPPENLLPDSARARRRIGKLMELLTKNFSVPLSHLLERELGVSVNVSDSSHWPRYCDKCEIRDLLDGITITHKYLAAGASGGAWLEGVRRIFAESHLAYEIDDQGIVHPAVDQEFQRNRAATIAGLQATRYANSLAAFQRVSDELSAVPPNGKDAWRAVFGAVEGLFRLMFPAAHQLNAGLVDVHLTPLIQTLHAQDAIASRAAIKQLASFKDWVDASHFYRHESGSEEPVQPPIDLAILAISNGTAFLRWLVAVDQVNNPSS
jgi:hypothetical protein